MSLVVNKISKLWLHNLLNMIKVDILWNDTYLKWTDLCSHLSLWWCVVRILSRFAWHGGAPSGRGGPSPFCCSAACLCWLKFGQSDSDSLISCAGSLQYSCGLQWDNADARTQSQSTPELHSLRRARSGRVCERESELPRRTNTWRLLTVCQSSQITDMLSLLGRTLWRMLK